MRQVEGTAAPGRSPTQVGRGPVRENLPPWVMLSPSLVTWGANMGMVSSPGARVGPIASSHIEEPADESEFSVSSRG